MTERLFWSDPGLRRFTAVVMTVEGDGRHVVLDRTAFYPTSGGQPHDVGTLGGIRVIDVVEEDARLVHRLAAPLAATTVEGVVDDARRTDHSTQHTAQHLLSALLEDRFQRPTIAFHLGSETVSIDIAGHPFGVRQFAEVEFAVAEAIRENRAVSSAVHADVTALRLRKPTDRTGDIRVVTIDGLDVNACGGTHVGRTGELGSVLLLDVEKLRDATRLTFVAGLRGMRRMRSDRELLAASAAALGCAADDIPALAAKQKAALLEAEKDLRVHRKAAAEQAAAARHAATVPDALGRRRLLLTLPGAIGEAERVLAAGFAALPGGVAVVTADEGRTVLMAAAADTGLDCGRVLKAALAAVGGRGGGQATAAQGTVPDAAALAAVRTALLASLD
jgi:alanyl-tRNA synthetase